MFRKLFLFSLALVVISGTKISPKLTKVLTENKKDHVKEVENVRDCGSIGTFVSMAITGCSLSPCVVQPGNDYDIELIFTPAQSSSSLHLKIIAFALGGEFAIIDSPVPGNIEGGTTYMLTAVVSVAENFLDAPLEIQFQLTDVPSSRMEICAATDIAVRVAPTSQRVYFDMTQGGSSIGRIILGMFNETVPLTVNNFVTICTSGLPSAGGKTYSGSIFHRVINNFMIQGGDVLNGDGTGSGSIYGPSFPDENFTIKHRAPGYLSMANSGPNTNGCQFFITTVATPHLDGGHVIFGTVLDGMSVVNQIGQTQTDGSDRPTVPVIIGQCGLL